MLQSNADSRTRQNMTNKTNELPGSLQLAIAVKKGEWPHTMDAKVWAEKFNAVAPVQLDDGFLIAWFANAIMAGYDQGRLAEREKE